MSVKSKEKGNTHPLNNEMHAHNGLQFIKYHCKHFKKNSRENFVKKYETYIRSGADTTMNRKYKTNIRSGADNIINLCGLGGIKIQPTFVLVRVVRED